MKQPKRKVGRRSKLTPRVHNRIVSALRAGNYTTVAAGYAGIGRATFYRWMQRGRDAPRGRYRRFYRAVRQALAEAEVRAVAIVMKHAEKHWQAAMTFLERRYPQRWARRPPLPDPRQTLSELLGISLSEFDELFAT